MKVTDTLALSTRMFHTRMLRTALTILGMAVGIGTIVFLFSLGSGLQELLIGRIAKNEALLSLDVYPGDSELLKLDIRALKQFAVLPSVKKVIPVAIFGSQITDDTGTTDASAQMADPEIFSLNGIDGPSRGAFYKSGDTTGILVTSALVETFGWDPDAVIGKHITLTIFVDESLMYYAAPDEQANKKEIVKTVTIIGTLTSESPSVYFSAGVVPEIRMLEYAQAKVNVNNAEALNAARNAIIEFGYNVQALSDIVDQANKIFLAVQIILVVFGAAALVVSAIGMINTMTIAFLERTQEIGIMRSLGASRADMFWLFLIESGLMGFLGGVGGVLIGLSGQAIVSTGLAVLARQLGGVHVDIFQTPVWFVVVIVVFSTLVGFLTGILPGRRAFHLNPLVALKYK